MAGTRKNKSGTYTAQVRLKGFPSVSRNFSSAALARAWKKKTEDSMRSGEYQLDANMTIEELLNKYLQEIVPLKKLNKETGKNASNMHKSNINNLMALGQYYVSNLTADIIVNYVKTRNKYVKPNGELLSSETIRKEINTLNHILKTGVALWGLKINNPVPIAKDILSATKALKPSEPRTRRLNDGEENLLLEAMRFSANTKLAFLLTLSTGRRLSEITGITENSIVLRNDRMFLTVSDTKTGKSINVPLPHSAVGLIRFRNGKLFSCRTDSISQGFARACKRAELEDITLHDMRREALSRLFEKGFNVAEVMAISGHQTADILMKVYAQVNADKLSEKLSKL